MAGLGFRTFTAGAVLTAAQVQGYLQEQAIMKFATTAARTSALASPTQGMMSFISSSNSYWQYYELYNASTNPGGAATAGWYPAEGTVLFAGKRNNTSLSIPNDTYTVVSFNTFACAGSTSNTDTIQINSATIPSVFTVRQTGWYAIGGSVRTPAWSSTAGTSRALAINQGSTTYSTSTLIQATETDPTGIAGAVNESSAYLLAAGSNIRMFIYQNSMVKDRLDRELVGNVSIRVLPTERPDAWEVQGRGELALAILVEQMRREGYELTVGKPQVVTKKVDGKLHEPVEDLTIDVPEEFLGAITQLLASRKGRMKNMINHGTGWVRMEFMVPSRGLIGFRTEFLTTTRGTGIANAISAGYEPWFGEIVTRTNGSLISDRPGAVTPFALIGLQDRGTFFVEPTDEVYAGQVVGENARADDMEVNITKEKKLTNMRASSSEEFEKLTPPRKLSLEECLEFAREDECVEVTPEGTRIRKLELDPNIRARAASARKRASES